MKRLEIIRLCIWFLKDFKIFDLLALNLGFINTENVSKWPFDLNIFEWALCWTLVFNHVYVVL